MVTTNSDNDINEIQELFRELVERTTQLVADVEQSEYDLLGQATELFRMAARSVVPVLKYVDREVPTENERRTVRGILLEEDWGIILGRDGNIHWVSTPRTVTIEDFNLNSWPLDTAVDKLILMLKWLAQAFTGALQKMAERRVHITERAEQLARAAKAFEEK